MAVNFDTTPTEAGIIKAIAERAITRLKQLDQHRHWDILSLEMDITAVHLNGCPLRLGALLTAPDADFAHDVVGISEHIDRSTGKLEHHFQPRYAR